MARSGATLCLLVAIAIAGCAHHTADVGHSADSPSATPTIVPMPPRTLPPAPTPQEPEVVDSTGAPRPDDYVYVKELPVAVKKVPPEYPIAARAAGVEGIVMVQALVQKDGSVGDVRIVKSIPGLDEAAMACVRQWMFTPAMNGKESVAVWVGIPVKFSMH